MTVSGQETVPVVEHALWICPCMSDASTPVWLIYEETEGTLKWCRIPEGSDVSDVVEARFIAGGHADPGSVLAWLRGDAQDPWAGGGEGWGDDIAAREIGRKLSGG